VALFLVLVASATSLVGVQAASAKRRHPTPPPPPPSNWQLVDYQQQACFSANVHDTWFGIWINGTWTSAIDVGAAGRRLRHELRPHPAGLEHGHLLAGVRTCLVRDAAADRRVHGVDLGE
jgi:hypothetical protein